jgi:hypothetical protein
LVISAPSSCSKARIDAEILTMDLRLSAVSGKEARAKADEKPDKKLRDIPLRRCACRISEHGVKAPQKANRQQNENG